MMHASLARLLLLFVLMTSALTTASAQSAEEPRVRVFPRVSLFSPLAADLRWPKFTLGYNYYIGDSDLSHAGSTDAGASIAIVQKDNKRRLGAWEIGFQAGVFAVFNLAAPSSDLINADYVAGITFTYAFDALAFMARFMHQSSHLGDEYLLNNEAERINLSFEEISALLSYVPRDWARVYGGAAVIVRSDPSELDRWSLQLGAEFRPVTATTERRLQLLVAANLQSWQESDWIPDASLLAGLTLDPIGESSYRVDFLLRYYIGRSPNGQFFSERIQTIGPAVQLYF